MKKLLFLFDTDPYPSVFDTVVGYDGAQTASPATPTSRQKMSAP